MIYTELDVRLKEINPFADILIARLNEINFDSYVEDKSGIKAYVRTELLDNFALNAIISEISELTELSFTLSNIKPQNWNAKWESNYNPVFINENCVVRTHFHNAVNDVKYEIIISPKMSFGTGHHETTSLMMKEMFDLDFKGRSVLDIGTGTGVLAILAAKLGARKLIGIDLDEYAFENSKQNAQLNNISNIHFINGDVQSIGNEKYDVILANINRNIILNDIEVYVSAMESGATILLSGFLEDDITLILDKTKQFGLKLVDLKNKNKWQMLHLKGA